MTCENCEVLETRVAMLEQAVVYWRRYGEIARIQERLYLQRVEQARILRWLFRSPNPWVHAGALVAANIVRDMPMLVVEVDQINATVGKLLPGAKIQWLGDQMAPNAPLQGLLLGATDPWELQPVRG